MSHINMFGNAIRLFIVFVLLIAVANIVSADFIIKSVDVKVDGKKDSDVNNGDTVAREAVPESDVEVDVEVENTFSYDDGIEVEDIEITVTIIGIDDDDDLDPDEEIDEFDLKADKEKTKSVDFEIPLKVDEDLYTIEIRVEARDDNGTEYDLRWTVYLELEKENHELRLYTALNMQEFECDRDGKLEVEILNLGQDDEEEVVLEIKSDELGIDIRTEEIELSNDLFDDDSSYFRSVAFTVPEELEPDVYTISIYAYYRSRNLDPDAFAAVEVIVKDCEPEVTTTTTVPTTTTTVAAGMGDITGGAVQQPYDPTEIVEAEPLEEGIGASTILLIALIVLVLITLAVLITASLIKK